MDVTGSDAERFAVDLRWRSGREESLAVDVDQTVLDAAADASVALPFGCLTGACGTCTGKVVAGELVHRRPPRALKARHLDDGYALLCIAEPRADSEVEVGSDVASDLVSNPWK